MTQTFVKIHHPLYHTWNQMIRRCHYEKHKKYPRYGGRGIIVCDRWRYSFDNFIADMGEKPTPKHSIDRVNNDGNYEPVNCRWATNIQQCRNYSKNITVTFEGKEMCALDFANRINMKYGIIKYRIRQGKTAKEIIEMYGLKIAS